MTTHTETIMDQEIREAFQTVFTKIDNLPCGERGIQLARIEQKQVNGETQKKTRIELWKIWISLAALIIVVAEVVDKFVIN